MPHISIKAEPIFHLLGIAITNSYLASIIVIIATLFIGLYYKKQITASKKSGFFYTLHFILSSIYDMFYSVVGENIYFFFPLLISFFLYILFQNWFGLVPGVGSILVKIQENHETALVPLLRGNTADLNTTLALGVASISMIQFYGIQFLGFKTYISKFINLTNPISFFIGILEVLSEVSKIFSFSFRLFGNIFAGEVLLTIVAFLVPVLASFPFLLLELFVGFIQALVFTMLTSVFLNAAVQKHH